MAIAKVRDTGRITLAGGNGASGSFAALPSAASMISMHVAAWNNYSGAISTGDVTDNQGNGNYNLDIGLDVGTWSKAGIFSKQNIGAPSGTFTLFYDPIGDNVYCECIGAEFSGIATASALDKTASASGSSASPSVTLAEATTEADELILGLVSAFDGSSADIGIDAHGDYTTLGSIIQDPASTMGFYAAYRTVSSIGTYTFHGGTLSRAPNEGWIALMATYKAASAPAEDTTPDAFSFNDKTDVPLNTEIVSDPITVAGINAAAAISVTGGEYRIDGGSWTSTAGTVTNGQQVEVRHTSSGSYSTATNTVLTIGGVSDTFTSTTIAEPSLEPTLTDINGDEEIELGSEDNTFTGTNTDEGDVTLKLIQGEVEIEQTITFNTGTGGEFDCVGDREEPLTSLKAGEAIAELETDEGSDTLAVTLTLPEGYGYVDLESVAGADKILETDPELEAGDQVQWRNVQGDGELEVLSDGSIVRDEGVTAAEFRAWDHDDATYGPWVEISFVATSSGRARLVGNPLVNSNLLVRMS